MRVLIVDDNTESLETAASMLRDVGAEVRTASSASVAYELLQHWQPDVVLTDLAMPGEDGFMLLRAIRRVVVGHRPRMPMIAVTAYATPDNRAQALGAGFDLVLDEADRSVTPRRRSGRGVGAQTLTASPRLTRTATHAAPQRQYPGTQSPQSSAYPLRSRRRTRDILRHLSCFSPEVGPHGVKDLFSMDGEPER